MTVETCSHNHEAPSAALIDLHESQAGKHRHKCCICAYHEGYRLGLTDRALPAGEAQNCHAGHSLATAVLDKLPYSQAGEGRHKCAICAFHLGFEAAKPQPSATIGTTHEGFGDGSKKYQERARQALPLLIAQAKARNTITYGQLALEMNMPNPRNLNMVLGAVGNELKNLSEEWKEKIPPITCLVINKHEKTPQRGIEFHMPPGEFERLSPSRQEEVLHHINSDIWDYKRWDEVLRYFKLEPEVPARSKALQLVAKGDDYGRGGGESEEHRKLKEYVKKNPQVIGLSKLCEGETEYRFFSNDEIDVLFRSSSNWVGVEVKGIHSDIPDILRGIFQCVKYKALIEATQRLEQVEVDGRVILVLGGTLPTELRTAVGILKIDLREKVELPDNS